MKFWSRSYENVLTMRYLIRQIAEFLSTAFGVFFMACLSALFFKWCDGETFVELVFGAGMPLPRDTR